MEGECCQCRCMKSYQSDKAYYDRIDGGRGDGHLLHFAYTQYNQDMKYFVELRGMSPGTTRARRSSGSTMKCLSLSSARRQTSSFDLRRGQRGR